MKKIRVINANPNAQSRWHLIVKKRKTELILGIASLVIAVLYGAWGVRLSYTQIELSKKQDSTSLAIVNFDTLLRKTDTLLDRQTALIDSSSKQIKSLIKLNETLLQQYHLNTQSKKEEIYNKLLEKYYNYNTLAYSLTDISAETLIFYDGKMNRIERKIPLLKERLKMIISIETNLRNIKLIENLIPIKTVTDKWGKCLTHISNYKQLYSYDVDRGIEIDTSKSGQNDFNNVIFEVMDFRDSVRKYINIERDKTQKEIHKIVNSNHPIEL